MAITERITKNTDNIYWDSGDTDFPVRNRYTAGVAGQKFFENLKENGKIYGTTCQDCDVTFVPGKHFCERCFAKLDQWVDVGLSGTVFSYTVSCKEKDGSMKKTPSIIAAVKIADGIILHRLGECSPDEVSIDMKVTAAVKPKKERTGSLTDIKYFKPAK